MLSADSITRRALGMGFDLCGIARAGALPELRALPDWLARGYAGEMIYLHKSAHTRADIRNFLPGARSVIVTATNYHVATSDARLPTSDAQAPTRDPRPVDIVRVARYARGLDYHLVLAERLEALLAWMRAEHPEPFDAAIFVDKHHVQERAHALHAGLGWIGKNTMLINREVGSWTLLAGMAVSLPLDPGTPQPDQCGTCTLCLDACPTGALVDAHVLDATRCISYLTIEQAGLMTPEWRPSVGSHLFGCDICQEVCPWNLASPETRDPAWLPRVAGEARASDLWRRSDQELHAFVRGSAMTHAPLAQLRRNLATVLGNSGDPALLPVLDAPGRGVPNAAHSAKTPVVQDAVGWARARLAPGGD